jgi:Tfp pilus assembly protein FimV
MPPKIPKTSSSAKKKKKTVVVDLSDSEDDNDMKSNDSDDESDALVVEPPKKSVDSTKKKSQSKNKSPSSSTAPSSPKKLPSSPEAAAEPVNDAFDVILPPLLGTNSNGECTVLVQLDPQDAVTLDYEGVSGAIGRFEADDRGGKYDSKQFRHHFANARLFDLRARSLLPLLCGI